MSQHRSRLPQLGGGFFLTDGGIETTLIFHDGFDLPYFAAFDLLNQAEGRAALKRYFDRYAAIAASGDIGFILESPTWRASADWGEKLGYSSAGLDRVNRDAIALMQGVRVSHPVSPAPIVISGCIGPRGDGYDPGSVMTPVEAERYHAAQVNTFADTTADMVTAITMTNVNEAIGVARAAKRAGMPAVISFTVETDGRLPTGQALGDAINEVDAVTNNYPAYYMINCAHPTHFAATLAAAGAWIERIRGIRANASKCSHQELDEAEELDAGDPRALAREYRELCQRYRHINVLGGCCGTDERHLRAIAAACYGTEAAA